MAKRKKPIIAFTKKERAFQGGGKYGTKKRRKEKVPAHVFLLPKERKFPVKVKKNGKWVYSRRLITAAIRRAAQYGYSSVERKARALLNRLFPKVDGRKGVYTAAKKTKKKTPKRKTTKKKRKYLVLYRT